MAFAAIMALSACDEPSLPVGGGVFAKDGPTLYATQCAVCHGGDGRGVAGLHPPLAGSEWTNGSQDRLIALTLDGLAGEMRVQGVAYRGVMPAWKSVLNDAQIAAVLTHVRQAWGNQAPSIEAVDVTRVRRQNTGRNAFWSPAELEALAPPPASP